MNHLVSLFRNIYFAVALFLFFSRSLVAQTDKFSVRGRIVDGNGSPVEFASAYVVRSGDSQTAFRAGADSDSTGSFLFEAPKGDYMFEVYFLGYEKHLVPLNVNKDIDLGEIVIKQIAQSIKSAVVVASPVDYNISGYKLNVQNIPMLHRMSLEELFITSPGLQMTPNAIEAYGKVVTKIYVDKREIKLIGDALISYLNSIDVKRIKDIEVITNPGVEDYKDIILKVTTFQEAGGSMSISGRVSAGEATKQVSPTINISHRHGKFSVYAMGSLLHLFTKDSTTVTISRGSAILQSETKFSKGEVPRTINSVVGVIYDISPNDYISADVSNRNLLRRDNILSLLNDNLLTQDMLSNTLNISALYSHTFNNKSKFNVRADYNNQLQDNFNTEDIYNSSRQDGYSIKEATLVNSYNLKGDYTASFLKKDKFAVGAGYSTLFNEYTNSTISDRNLKYTEKVAHLYSSYSYSFNSLSIRAGARGEYRIINGIPFWSLIPETTLSYFIDKTRGSNMSISYLRTTKMPTMASLTPMQRLSSLYITIGNPELQPALMHTIKYGFIFRNMFSLHSSYIYSNNAITSYAYERDGLLYTKPINGALSHELDISAGLSSINPFKWLSLNLTVTYNYSVESAMGVTNKSHYVQYVGSSMMFLPNNINVTMMLIGGSNSRRGANIIQSNPANLNISASKTLLNGAMRVSLNVSDICNSGQRRYYEVEVNNITQRICQHINTVNFGFSVSYNLGWGKRMAIKKMSPSEASSRITD